MKALKCDRCGKFFMRKELNDAFGNDENVYYVVNSLYGSACDSMYDLCIDCYRELKAWMEAKK